MISDYVPRHSVINKIDKVHPDQLLEQIDDFLDTNGIKEISPFLPQGNNVPCLMELLKENLEEGFQYFLSRGSSITRTLFGFEMIRENFEINRARSTAFSSY